MSLTLEQRTSVASGLLPTVKATLPPRIVALTAECARSSNTKDWSSVGYALSTSAAFLGCLVKIRVAPGSTWVSGCRPWVLGTGNSGSGKSVLHKFFYQAVAFSDHLIREKTRAACTVRRLLNLEPEEASIIDRTNTMPAMFEAMKKRPDRTLLGIYDEAKKKLDSFDSGSSGKGRAAPERAQFLMLRDGTVWTYGLKEAGHDQQQLGTTNYNFCGFIQNELLQDMSRENEDGKWNRFLIIFLEMGFFNLGETLVTSDEAMERIFCDIVPDADGREAIRQLQRRLGEISVGDFDCFGSPSKEGRSEGVAMRVGQSGDAEAPRRPRNQVSLLVAILTQLYLDLHDIGHDLVMESDELKSRANKKAKLSEEDRASAADSGTYVLDKEFTLGDDADVERYLASLRGEVDAEGAEPQSAFELFASEHDRIQFQVLKPLADAGLFSGAGIFAKNKNTILEVALVMYLIDHCLANPAWKARGLGHPSMVVPKEVMRQAIDLVDSLTQQRMLVFQHNHNLLPIVYPDLVSLLHGTGFEEVAGEAKRLSGQGVRKAKAIVLNATQKDIQRLLLFHGANLDMPSRVQFTQSECNVARICGKDKKTDFYRDLLNLMCEGDTAAGVPKLLELVNKSGQARVYKKRLPSTPVELSDMSRDLGMLLVPLTSFIPPGHFGNAPTAEARAAEVDGCAMEPTEALTPLAAMLGTNLSAEPSHQV